MDKILDVPYQPIKPFKKLTKSEAQSYAARRSAESVSSQIYATLHALEKDLANQGSYHVLQLVLDEEPLWPFAFYTNGEFVFKTNWHYCHACFLEDGRKFYNILREAVIETEQPQISKKQYETIQVMRSIVKLDNKIAAQEEKNSSRL